ncbi:MAG: hypothetical protein HN580_15195 [Deltaproteobacteria bacterium]|jgi:hypothetical protein|nr:hypothetical protein [Deltaproteobacteria bacterium]MBT4641689.1 hypothetical protein [Deltaproteobacteria bacterium]MBT7715295.1 hypothetical protein [Deltaproteobacteria bacterium]MBT7890367.1 hypothetical protein [Deltaproteobacteria bacterium]
MMSKFARLRDPGHLRKIGWLFIIAALSGSLLSCSVKEQPLSTDHRQTAVEKKENMPDMGSTPQRHRKNSPKVRPALDRMQLESFFSGLNPPNWKTHDKVRHFTPENLYEIINGAAELYLSYDVVQLSYVSFIKAGDSSSFIDVSLYDLGNPTNAFGVFSVERSPDGLKLNLGRISYRQASSIFIWKGRYYAIITGSKSSEGLNAVGLELAQQVDGFLEDMAEPVWGLTVFPEKNRLPGTIKYFKVDALGLAFMQNTYTADYLIHNTPSTAFLSLQKTTAEVRSRIAHYANHSAKFGRGAETITENEMEFLVCNMDGTFDVVFQSGLIMGGVTAVTDRSLAIQAAKAFRKQVRQKLK